MLRKIHLPVLGVLALAMTVTLGCSSGRRGMSIHGPIHDVNLAYDVDEDADGHRDVSLVRVIERRD